MWWLKIGTNFKTSVTILSLFSMATISLNKRNLSKKIWLYSKMTYCSKIHSSWHIQNTLFFRRFIEITARVFCSLFSQDIFFRRKLTIFASDFWLILLYKVLFLLKSLDFVLPSLLLSVQVKVEYTTWNTEVLPYLLVWKFRGNAWFPQSLGRFALNSTEAVSFHKISKPES